MRTCVLKVACLFSGCVVSSSVQVGSTSFSIVSHVASGGQVLTFTSTIPDINSFIPNIYIALMDSSSMGLASVVNVTVSVNDATPASITIRGGPKETVITRTYKVTRNIPNQRPSIYRDFDTLYPARGEDGLRWVSRLASSFINILQSDSSLPFAQGRRLTSLRSEVTQVIPWSSMSLSPFLGAGEAIYDVELAVDLRRSVVLDRTSFYGMPGSNVIIGDIRVVDADADDKNVTAIMSIPSNLASSGWSISFTQLSPLLLVTSSVTSVTLVGAMNPIARAFNQIRVQIGSVTSALLTIEVTDGGAWVLQSRLNAV